MGRHSSSVVYVDSSGDLRDPFSLCFNPKDGPFCRSFNEGRRIFSSGRSLVGAGGWFGWGLPRLKYDLKAKETVIEKEALERALVKFWEEIPLSPLPARRSRFDDTHWYAHGISIDSSASLEQRSSILDPVRKRERADSLEKVFE